MGGGGGGGGGGERGGGGEGGGINYTASYIYSLHYTFQSIDYSPHVGIHVASCVPHMQQVMMTSNNVVMTDLHPNVGCKQLGE